MKTVNIFNILVKYLEFGMKDKYLLLIITVLLISNNIVFAQGNGDKNIKKEDSVKSSIQRSFLDVYYGESQLTREGLKGEAINTNVYGILLGGKEEKKHSDSNNVIIQDKYGLSLTLGSAKNVQSSDSLYQGVSLTNANALDFWSLGIITGKGYGYDWGDAILMLTVEDNITWTNISPRSYNISQTQNDWQYIMDFDGPLRYGSSMTSSMEIRVSNTFSLTGGYTWNQVMPRHMVWYWMGSEIMELFATRSIDVMMEKYIDISPKSQPVVHFILKSAALYGMKELRRKYMNWPFETASPMNITYWNIGVGLTL